VSKWYLDLFSNYGARSKVLSQASIKQIVKPWTQMAPGEEVYFGQGIVVSYESVKGIKSSVKDFPTVVTYCGGTLCATTCIEMLIQDASKSTIAAAFTNHEYMIFANESTFNELKNTADATQVSQDPRVQLADGDASAVRSALLKIWAF
jgi:hypothetical protein